MGISAASSAPHPVVESVRAWSNLRDALCELALHEFSLRVYARAVSQRVEHHASNATIA